jgi:dTDP-3-amino-3,4,6-trideoxy-alpha-D-glucose transaminase
MPRLTFCSCPQAAGLVRRSFDVHEVRSEPVPLTRLDNADPALLSELMSAIERVASRAAFTLGAEVEGFEAEFAEYCQTSQAVGVSSGTEALVLCLRALDIGPEDEVIVPTNSFIATAEAVSLVGATPRLVDVDPDTHLITAEIIESAIGPRTRCVIPVHLYGRTVDMAAILELAGERGLRVVEDACQAHGARYHGRRVGSLGDCGCFSFYPAKNLGAWGDGGGVVTNDADLADRVRLLRAHGENPRYHHRVVGSTARLDAIQAAVLRVKLRHLDDWNERRRRAGAALTTVLSGTSVRAPVPPTPGTDHVFHQYVVETDERDHLRDQLERDGVATGIHYPVPIHRSDAYAELGMGPGTLPIAEGLAERICSLPMHPALTDEEIARVAGAVERVAPITDSLAA